jgi:hypothetical protein
MARIKLFAFTVWLTVWLLAIGAILAILGTFNQQLRWDIFSPQVETVLYGMFFSCLILSTFGVAITFVLGIKRIVEAVESLQRRGQLDPSLMAPRTQRLTYVGYMMGLLISFSALVGVLEFADYRIQTHRSQVFKQVAAEQTQKFTAEMVPPLTQINASSSNGAATNIVPRPLPELLSALNGLSFVQTITLYVPNPQDDSLLWRHTNYEVNPQGQPIFDRFLPAKEFEAAIAQALQGDPTALQALNQRRNFTWYQLITAGDRPVAVLKIDGNPQENFREYTSEPAYQLD